MSLKGNLSSVNLTEIFQMLSLSGREGTLFIYEGARKRAICFTKEGVSIRSRERNEGLLIGKILVRQGKVDERSLQQAIETRRTSDKLIGDVLVEAGCCTAEDIEGGLRVQSEEEIQDLFLNRSDAQFEYVDGYFPEADFPYVHLNVNSLLIDIARRTDEWEYIRRRIRGPREIYRFTGTEGHVEPEVLAECGSHRVDPLIDGTHSVGELIDHSYVNKFEVCKLLATYLDAAVIELVPPDAIRQNARLALRMGDTEGAIRHYEYLMGTGDFPLDVMGEAAQAHEANRDFAEAAALLRRLAEELVRSGDCRAAIDTLIPVANYPRAEPEALRYLMELVFENPRAASEFAENVVEAGKTLVNYYSTHDQEREALTLLERLILVFPDEIAFAVSLVNVYYEEGNIAEAAQECERLAHNFAKRKRPSHAVSLYKKLLLIDPERGDVREKIRKMMTGRKRRSMPPALPRVAIALAITLLLAGVAVVFLDRKGGSGDPTGLDQRTLTALFGRAVDEKTSAAEHGRRAADGYSKLLDFLSNDPVANREALVDGMHSAERHYQLFGDGAEKATSVADTIRKQSTDAEVRARAQAMLDALEEQETLVQAARNRWRNSAQRTAEQLREVGVRHFEKGRLLRALEHFELAEKLASRQEWKLQVDLEGQINIIRKDVNHVANKLKEARRYEEDGGWSSARRIYLGLLHSYRNADLVQDVRLPVEVLSVPPGAKIRLNGKAFGQPTPTIVRLAPGKETIVELRKTGFKTDRLRLGPFGEGTNPAKFQYKRYLLKTATWTQQIGDHIEADAVAWRDRVAVVGRNGRWAVFDAKRKREIERGTLKTLDGITAGLVTNGKSFFVPTLDGKLIAFDCNTAKPTYAYPGARAPIRAKPAVATGVLYLVDESGYVIAFDVAARKRLWAKQAAHGVRAAPVVHGEDLVVVSRSGDVTVFKRKTGAVVIRYRLPGVFESAPAIAGADDLVFASEDGLLLGVTRATGEITWRQPTRVRLRRTPPVRGRAVFVSPKPGELIAYDTKTGDEIYRYTRSPAGIDAPVRPTDRIFFVQGQTLSAFAPRADGYGLAWTFQANARILSGPVLHGGAVYVGDEKGYIYRLEAND